MPIYDFNGTTKQEIGKLYDYDGTATHQIGKVYDNNGSANSLVYSGETVLYEANTFNTDVWGTLQWYEVGESDYTLNADNIYVHSYNNPSRNTWGHITFGSSNKVNLAGFSTLNMEVMFDTSKTTTTKVGFIIQSSLGIGGDNPQNASSTVKYDYCTSAATRTTFSLDLSDVQGEYCVVVDSAPNGGWYKSAKAYIYKIWLE